MHGPRIRIELSCFDCDYCVGESYRCQGDSGTVLVLMLKFNYANGWAPADYITLATVLLGIGGAQVMPSIFGGRKS